ncbi:MAG TPA: isochorismatase family protein [Alphaproteobacteria bacterium]|nr:isochorismatase family protein [Alphaproteobacteria bacterium]
MSGPPPRIWDRYLTERDREIFAASGYAQRAGFGKRPALAVIDVSYGFAGDRPEPILEAIKRWPNTCGETSWPAIEVIARVLAAGRSKGLPVVYSTYEWHPSGFDMGGWLWKNKRMLEPGAIDNAGNEIVAAIAPRENDIVIKKKKPSAFFGTPLLSYLVDLKVDSLLFMGTTTSGCVRATVVDAFSNNLRCIVVEDGCFDRSEVSHAINLRDMDAKYADVVSSREVLTYIQDLPPDLFRGA